MTEETAAISSVISRASTILLSLNDAIERAMKNEIGFTNSTRNSPTKPQEQRNARLTPSDSAVEYVYSSQPDGYMPQVRPQYLERPSAGDFSTYSSRRSSRDISRGDPKGEAMMLGKIRDVLLELEEQLYRIQELDDHQLEGRAAASEEVDRKREELVQLLQQHKGQEWQVVHEVMKFAGGNDFQEADAIEFVWGRHNEPLVTQRVMAQSESRRASDIGAGEVIENLQGRLDSAVSSKGEGTPLFNPRASVSMSQNSALWQGTEEGFVQDWDDSESMATEKGCNSRDVHSELFLSNNNGDRDMEREREPSFNQGLETVLRDDDFGDGEVHDFSAGDGLSVTAAHEIFDGEEDGIEVMEEDTDLGSVVMSLPGKALCLLGDAAGHVASFSVKVAVVTLGVAAVFSVGDKLIRAEKVRVRSVMSDSSGRVLSAATKKRAAPATLVSPKEGKMPVKGPEKKCVPMETTKQSSFGNGGAPPPKPEDHKHHHHHHNFQDGTFPQCTIRERMERKSSPQQNVGGRRKQAVYLARG